jgi:Flp pilus assembly protein TadG
MKAMATIWFGLRRSAAALRDDRRGLAAIEFAIILPIMLVMFFGTVALSSGVAVDRKVTLMARTLSDLTSQSGAVADSDMTNFFAAAGAIMTPYDVAPLANPTTPTHPTISEISIDNSGKALILWSKAATIAMVNGAPVATLVPSIHSPGNQVPVPSTLVPGAGQPPSCYTWSEVNYLYKPTFGYVVMSAAGVTLSDTAYTRPRQGPSVNYGTTPSTSCP